MRGTFIFLSLIAFSAGVANYAQADGIVCDPPKESSPGTGVAPLEQTLPGAMAWIPGTQEVVSNETYWYPKKCDWRLQTFPEPNPNEGLKEVPSLDPHCLDGMVRVGHFCMDQYMGVLEELPTHKAWSPFHNPTKFGDHKKFRAVSVKGAIPQGNISRTEAEAACEANGKRLCSASEWIRACRGKWPHHRMFPYGGKREEDRDPGACNDIHRRVHPPIELWLSMPKNERPGKSIDDGPYLTMQNACVLQREGTVTRTGSLEKCKTPEGVYDLVGNLHEWTSETKANGNGVFRGGYFMDTKLNGPGCFYATTAHRPEHWDYSTGFRCCADIQHYN